MAGNTQLRYKEAMNRLESASPGTKAQFFLGFLDRAAPLFAAQDDATPTACLRCGEPTTGRFCAFCRARAQIRGERLDEHIASQTSPDAELVRELSNEVMPVAIYSSAAG